jgi:hypothetical protein
MKITSNKKVTKSEKKSTKTASPSAKTTLHYGGFFLVK